ILNSMDHKGPKRILEIHNSVLIKFGSITYVIDKLEKKGLIKRINSTTDRRVVYIHITEKGKEEMDIIFPKHQKVIENMFQNINHREKELLIDLLKKIGKGR